RDDDVIRGEAAEPLAGDIIEPSESAPEPTGEGSSQYPEAQSLAGAPAEETTSPGFESQPPAPEGGGSADQVEASIGHEATGRGGDRGGRHWRGGGESRCGRQRGRRSRSPAQRSDERERRRCAHDRGA